MCALSFECGSSTVSWNALLALRRRVNMSAIGSVIVIAALLSRGGSVCTDSAQWPAAKDVYQDDFVTPGSSPACAISRRQIRHRPNLRYTEWARPQRWQRV